MNIYSDCCAVLGQIREMDSIDTAQHAFLTHVKELPTIALHLNSSISSLSYTPQDDQLNPLDKLIVTFLA